MTGSTHYSPVHTMRTTALREIELLIRMKSIWATVILLLVGIVGFSAFLGWQANKAEDDLRSPLAVVGAPAEAFAGTSFEPREAQSRQEAEDLVLSGEVKAAVVATPQGFEVLASGEPPLSTVSQVQTIATGLAQAEALGQLGVSPEDYAASLPPAEVTANDVSAESTPDADPADGARMGTAIATVFISIFTVFIFAANVGSRVTVEKSSRVIELILSAVRPLDFLAGKIVGNVLFGLAATVFIVGVGAASFALAGLTESITISWGILPLMAVGWLLSMLFFSTLYAAAGAIVQRTEDLQSTQGPILILMMAAMYVPLFGIDSTDATWMQVASWIPPVSFFTAPLTYAAGDFSMAQLVSSLALGLVATVAAMWVAAKIYRNSVLNNGSKMTWAQALKAS
ncbi:ABC transporter permease [Corynebacterium liangguodongii]|uniref:ABC transporter permease n=1 Tax=Corynebacterium liangguodongii TaxID=2079535 RepID=A0A2S0WCW5_9CORY|nr:ABC transporter permease [Corynebacterium liangguodongii]AWB83609.1 ABC transporter permease [Corynebacterium liangguodongii]PWB99584.1 ABC transporter permease [Corynebacterium liangguodongii]